MGFWRYLLRSRADNGAALIVVVLLSGLYMAINLPFVRFMQEHAILLQDRSPFYGVPFTLNLFNFDPSMYYPAGAPTIIHPLKDLLAAPLAWGATHLGGNLFFLVVQSVVNAMSVALMFYYIRRCGGGMLLSVIWALFFGVSSYNLFTALIPDSYVYVQLVILVSLVYLLYVRTIAVGDKLWPQAILAAVNFAVTATNVATFMVSVGINLMDGKRRAGTFLARFLLIGAAGLLIALLLTGLQWLLFGGEAWLTSWRQGLSDGGFSYAAPFSWMHHWQAFYMLFVSPVLTPALDFIDPGLAAFVTDLSQPYPLHVHLIGGGLIVLALLGLIQGRRSRGVWIPAVYLGFALLLHLVVGFGLGTFRYDMYLYAGHSLFALFVLGAVYHLHLRSTRWRGLLLGLVAVCVVVTLIHNMILHAEALNTIRAAYQQ